MYFDTQAQWIWWTNLVCFLAHTFMVFLTLHMAYWRWTLPNGERRSMWTHTEHVTIRIHRVTQIPTPLMIANNETKWSPGWNLTNPRGGGGNEFYLRDNEMPVRNTRRHAHMPLCSQTLIHLAGQFRHADAQLLCDLRGLPPLGAHRRAVRALLVSL